jgi:hypothetical protein
MQVNSISKGRQRPLRRMAAGTALALVAGTAVLGSGASIAQAGPRTAGLSPRAAAVTPAGPVSGSGCTTTGSATACHLYAVAGSLTLPGQVAPVPAWKFRDSATVPADGALTGSGPVLVVNSGDTVTVTLDNVNVPDPVALAVPGLTGFSGAAGGVAAGAAAKTYTFTAGRAGTYLYEAGHTGNGSRQVLMGLAGALIVRPAGFTAATASDLGPTAVPSSTFNDEAVLVLGDLDPAFAANPLTFDLRNFNATYRTINGKVYPGTDQIPTAVNNKVLLRYLNAGLGNHSMGVAGLRQSVIASDSYSGSGMALVADQIAPGETEDMLVTVPAEGNYTIADAGAELDTAGLTTGTTQQLAFGGMMTLLGTSVTPPLTDTIGPKSDITAMTPNPAKVTTPVTLTTSFTDPAAGGPNAVTAAEVLIDGQATTVAPGTSALALTPTSTGTGTASGTFTLSSAVLGTLTQGKHRIYVRAMDSVGNWGALTSAVLNLTVTGASTINVSLTPTPTDGHADVVISATGDDSALGGTVDQARFTVDATGTFTAMTVASPGSAISAETGVLPAAVVQTLTEGTHTIWVQTHDSAGFWGPLASVSLVYDKTAPSSSAVAVSPSTTDGTVGDPVDPTSLKVTGTFTDVSAGAPTSNIVAAEGYFPPMAGAIQSTTMPANGTGFTFVASDGSFDQSTETAYGLIPLSELTAYPDGTFQVYVHGKDAAGNWGPWNPTSFTIKRGLFSDGFEAGTLAAWTGGTVPTVAGTRLTVNAAAKNTGSYGLAVTGSAKTAATVATPAITPAATGYHARFSFNPHSVTTTSGRTGIFTGLSGTAEAFQVQYQRGTTSAAAQVRLYFPLTGATTAWVTIGTTAWSSIQVDWATGTKATLTLTVNGAATSLTNRNTSTLKISSAKLGFLDATQNVVGTAWFDNFLSSLNPLP